MRIIAGKIKGLKLFAPKGMQVRPTADRVKESAFSILGEARIKEARVLDLFSGSGNLALEAFSRGASTALCVDSNEVSIKYIARNVEKAKAGGYVKVYRGDALKSIEFLARGKKLFDLIFCDPPYEMGWVELILKKIKKHNILAKDGIIVIEYSRHEKFFPPAGLHIERDEQYGETMTAFICGDALSGGKCEESNLPGQF
ncbi:MAG: 16S rRNA (guanine(966)-N(2))-methyltransferase RsmD [Acidaminococcales bacterium]|jgi:16S rRNA (guanine(966)-N(2))-methyltransferase RsmD|nr:16S rRNA (guanine(966)-N(2))-methyltransferase RsmD [Acidaminococcales bacterium]